MGDFAGRYSDLIANRLLKKPLATEEIVMPAKAGIQSL